MALRASSGDPFLAFFLAARDVHNGVAVDMADLAFADNELRRPEATGLRGHTWPRGHFCDDGFGCAAHGSLSDHIKKLVPMRTLNSDEA